MNTIKNILICGGGLMGKSIGLLFAMTEEFEVVIYDKRKLNLVEDMDSVISSLTETKIYEERHMINQISKIKTTNDIDDPIIKKSDLIIECVTEDLEIKKELFVNLESRCDTSAIFCTNTSVISPTEISSSLKFKERFIGTHFWNPGHLIPLVEVIKSKFTSDEVANKVMKIMIKLGKKPVLCKKDVPGFIANRMQHALWREAIYIVENEIADPKTVDDAVKYSFGLRLPQLGPFENIDMVGTDMTYNIHKYLFKYLCNSTEPSPKLKELVTKGKLGFKSSSGFQTWSEDEKNKSAKDLNTYLINKVYKNK